jgi:hypothetical protein
VEDRILQAIKAEITLKEQAEAAAKTAEQNAKNAADGKDALGTASWAGARKK